MKILVAIANYGNKNAPFLRRIIEEYRSMPEHVDLVVLSDIPKDLDPDIEVKVGLPAKDPWSLPFGHKKIFAERIEAYDLFIYSEDDILITRENIASFLEVIKELPEHQISGFLRYELDEAGRKWYPDYVGPYHWLPGSVKTAGRFTVAEFSNLHSACYILTRDQLRTAIRSGGYLVEPHQGRYDLLCSAATDPYTQCGFKKVICLAPLAGVLVHHLSNRYVGGFGITEDDFERQIAFMLSSEYRNEQTDPLFCMTKKIDSIAWDKVFYDEADRTLMARIPKTAKSILSIGSGYPSTEAALVQNRCAVTVIPLDPIMGALAAVHGMQVTASSFEKAFQELEGRVFDCIIVSEVLQHVQDPTEILSKAAALLAPGGELLISVPNFHYVKTFRDHFPYPCLRKWSYSKNLLHQIDKHHLARWIRAAGIKEIDFHYSVESPRLEKIGPSFGFFDVFLAKRLFARGGKKKGDHHESAKENTRS